MKEYTTAHLRNVAVLGHGNSGKTSLLDACLYHTGTAKRCGSVDEGTSLLDVLPERGRVCSTCYRRKRRAISRSR